MAAEEWREIQINSGYSYSNFVRKILKINAEILGRPQISFSQIQTLIIHYPIHSLPPFFFLPFKKKIKSFHIFFTKIQSFYYYYLYIYIYIYSPTAFWFQVFFAIQISGSDSSLHLRVFNNLGFFFFTQIFFFFFCFENFYLYDLFIGFDISDWIEVKKKLLITGAASGALISAAGKPEAKGFSMI